MYDNIGGKIKVWAVWIFIVEAIGAVIGGIAMIANDNGLIGFLTMLIGPFVAWVFSWLLYGFGQLIENSDIIAAEYSRKNEKHEKVVAQNIERKQAQRRKAMKAAIVNPEVEEDVFIDITCPNCNAELSYPKGQLQAGTTCPMCDAHISV
jgi:hypothetical protein